MSKSNISQKAMKAIGLFGGVQVLGILCSVVRTKLVALWIGPMGVGLFGIFNQALDMLSTATNLGVRQSSVRDISQAAEKGERSHISRVVAVVRRWAWWLGLGGTLVTMALAPLLSQWTFNDDQHIWGFVALSAAILFNSLTNGEHAVLQGLAKLKRLANANLFGTVFGLVVSVPLFYYLRADSVLPSIIAYAAGCLLFSIVFRDREYKAVRLTARETAVMGKEFVRLGIFMTVGTFIALLMDYVFRSWLNVVTSTAEVGFYTAGYTLVNRYTGMVLSALGMEYYPRLSQVAHSPRRLMAYVSKEISVAMMVMMPLVAVFILLRSEIVWLLYSKEFQVIVPFVMWGIMGTIFRALSWCLSFVMLAKGDGKMFLITETLSDVMGLALNIGCYLLWGLTGLGIAFLAWYVIYTAMMLVVYVRCYRLRLSWGCLADALWALGVAAAVAVAMPFSVALAAVLTVAAVAWAGVKIKRLWKG